MPPLGIINCCHLIWHTSIQVVKLFRQRVPDFRKDIYESGLLSIGTTEGVRNIWMLFVELPVA